MPGFQEKNTPRTDPRRNSQTGDGLARQKVVAPTPGADYLSYWLHRKISTTTKGGCVSTGAKGRSCEKDKWPRRVGGGSGRRSSSIGRRVRARGHRLGLLPRHGEHVSQHPSRFRSP